MGDARQPHIEVGIELRASCARRWRGVGRAAQAELEPPQLSQGRLQPGCWRPVIAALETLVLRCGALESVLEGREPLLNAAQLRHILGAPPGRRGPPLYRTARVACLRGRPRTVNPKLAGRTGATQFHAALVPLGRDEAEVHHQRNPVQPKAQISPVSDPTPTNGGCLRGRWPGERRI